MFIFLICVISAYFFLINLKINQNDLVNPSVLFPVLFILQIFTCVLALTYLKLQFHAEIFLILSYSFLIFTLFSIWNRSKQNEVSVSEGTKLLKSIYIPNYITIIVILLLAFTIYTQYKDLNKIATVAGLRGASLSDKIAFYDFLIKFDIERFRKIRAIVYFPRLISELMPAIQAYSFIIVYKLVNNFIVSRKVQMEDVLLLFLFTVHLYFTGSRSPIFRLVTFAVLIFYILTIKDGVNRKQLRKLIKRVLVIAFIVFVLFFTTLSLFGRSNNYNTFHYLFIYLGAPLYNLDNFIQTTSFPVTQDYFGQQTFQPFYNYLLPKLGRETYSLTLPFVKYSDTYGLGNVYTTFYQFLYDFGYVGLIILISIIAFFYTTEYRKLLSRPVVGTNFSFRLFVYAYLFNDLIMLIFSNRFYETITNVSTIKLFIFAYVFKSIIVDRAFVFGSAKIKIRLK